MDRRSFVKTCAAGAAVFSAPGLLAARLANETDAWFNARMAWWREARFGMFIHWGLYSIPAGVWKGRRSTAFPAEWLMYARDIPGDEYAKLAGQFNPVKFDAARWAGIAADAGMKYLVITSKHHDGFCMFDSKLSDYNIVRATPFGRDVIAELASACKDAGVRFGLYYSQLDWSRSWRPYSIYHMPHFKQYMEYMKGQVREILTGYGSICSLFFDGDWMPQWNAGIGREVEILCRGLQPEVIINSRLDKRTLADNISTLTGKMSEVQAPAVGDYATPEQVIPAALPACDWETCMTMNDSWGYRSWDDHWKSSTDLIRNLVDIVSKGGNYLLNVGPTSEGLIPRASVNILAEIGQWMRVNGEAIYGAKAGPIQDAPWGRTTQKNDAIYLHVFDWPGRELAVQGLSGEGRGARLLTARGAEPLDTRETDNALIISLPEKPVHPAAAVIAVE